MTHIPPPPPYQRQHQQYTAPPPPRRKSRAGLVIGIIVGVLAVIGAVVGVIALILNAILTPFQQASQDLRDALNNGDNASATSESAEYWITERPRYDEMVTVVAGMYDDYNRMLDDGSYTEIVGTTVNGAHYFHDFLRILLDEVGGIRFGVLTSSTDPGELDDIIDSKIGYALDLERKLHAGEDFNVTIRVERADGSVYESDGSNRSAILTPREAEAAARSFVPHLDANGTYVESATELAHMFGLELSRDFERAYDYCTRRTTSNNTIAAYCIVHPHVVWINTGFWGYPGFQSDPGFIDAIKHEIAHHRIGQICRTTQPVVAGELAEAVTSSYAVVFLGADGSELQHSAHSPTPQYIMSDATFDIATGIGQDLNCG
ncbi:MAG: hypothetical protein KF680_06325 [Cryobacterium sp.]|nr:hypothetical protein [Cryobacterium sp.]